MIPKLSSYQRIVGKEVIKRIRKSAENLHGKHVVHINSTAMGGGVAEILNTLVFLMNDLNIDTGWRILLGSQSFFKITKGIHNSLQGKEWKMSNNKKKIYLDYCRRNAIINHISDHDMIIIHDPQPLGMVASYDKKTKWIWRCHIDLSHPHQPTMDFFRPFIRKYDAVVTSSPKYYVRKVKKPQFIIHPSIDPLSAKNTRLSHEKAKKILSSHGIDLDKPVVSQISRFDPWKDPFGVIRMYEKIKKKADCKLILMGNMAHDDPQGPKIYQKVVNMAEKVKGVQLITDASDIVVNALQQEAHLLFQNSIREGFALTVSEALWKRTPVIGRPVGGIPYQIIDGKTGYLIRSIDAGAKKAARLLKNDALRARMGEAGREHVRKNFLITRHLEDYINLFNRFYPPPRLDD
ncbi:glycosyltransferase [Candidatus Woesearchaeota archaeon]|nr:glycosyltransferase [Candidatus Woesearchaeota archaeon]